MSFSSSHHHTRSICCTLTDLFLLIHHIFAKHSHLLWCVWSLFNGNLHHTGCSFRESFFFSSFLSRNTFFSHRHRWPIPIYLSAVTVMDVLLPIEVLFCLLSISLMKISLSRELDEGKACDATMSCANISFVISSCQPASRGQIVWVGKWTTKTWRPCSVVNCNSQQFVSNKSRCEREMKSAVDRNTELDTQTHISIFSLQCTS